MKPLELLAALLLAAAPARASLLDDLKAQAGAAATAGSPAGAPAAPAAAPTSAIAVTMVVGADGTPVLNASKDPDDEAGYQSAYVAELRRGETVGVLGQIPGWYQVEINRREYDEATGAWRKAKGWVKLGALVSGAASLSQDPARDASHDIPLTFSDLKPGDCRDAFIQRLKGFVGVPYRWGGTSHSGVDCSGLVQSAMLESGCLREAPPRTARDQQRAATPIGAAQLQPGDLIFHGTPAHHVFVYIGADASGVRQVIEAPMTGSVVNIHAWAPGAENFGSLLPKLEQ